MHYYNSGSPSTSLPVWEGTKNEEGNIVLYREQKSPDGTDGYSRLTFSDNTKDGFKSAGEWVSPDESVGYPTWKIDCSRRNTTGEEEEKTKIFRAAKIFSQAYMDADFETMANAYTEDWKIFPNNTGIITGRAHKRTVDPSGGIQNTGA